MSGIAGGVGWEEFPTFYLAAWTQQFYDEEEEKQSLELDRGTDGDRGDFAVFKAICSGRPNAVYIEKDKMRQLLPGLVAWVNDGNPLEPGCGPEAEVARLKAVLLDFSENANDGVREAGEGLLDFIENGFKRRNE